MRYILYTLGLVEKSFTNMYILFAAVPRTVDRQICLVGKAADDPAVVEAAGTFGVPVVTSITGIITSIFWLQKILHI